MRSIDADTLIADLEHDVEQDSRALDCMDLVGSERENVQFDKDCKQNTVDLLKRAPTIEPQQRWVPCKERLPERPEQVLVYARSVHYVLAKYEEHKKAWVVFDAYNVPTEIKHEVIAWMPLPEPYREVE